jgi:hypothetical protein
LTITSRHQIKWSQLPASGPTVHEPQQDEDLYDTFLQMRDLLEAYAPAWYFDDLRKRVESVVQPKNK